MISFVQSEDLSLAGDGSGEAETDTRDGYQEEMRAGTHFRLQTPHQNTKHKPQTICSLLRLEEYVLSPEGARGF